MLVFAGAIMFICGGNVNPMAQVAVRLRGVRPGRAQGDDIMKKDEWFPSSLPFPPRKHFYNPFYETHLTQELWGK